MTLLLAYGDTLWVETDAAVTVDVHASWTDLTVATAAVTPGRLNTAISTATSTPVVASPASGTVRKIKSLYVRNKHATSSVTITIVLTDSAPTSVQIDKRVLGPGSSIYIGEDGTVIPLAAGGLYYPAWATQVIGAYGNCDPGELMRHVQRASNVAATPTNITASIARCCTFVPPQDIVVNRIRYYGVGATTNVFRVAIYRMSDLARLTAELPYTTAAATWGSAGSNLRVTLNKDVVYFMATAVNTTGTTAGPVCVGTTVAATTGIISTAPGALPGSLVNTSAYLNGYNFQFAVTTGALPATAATLVAQATWTGGIPAYWLDTVDT